MFMRAHEQLEGVTGAAEDTSSRRCGGEGTETRHPLAQHAFERHRGQGKAVQLGGPIG